MSSYNSAMEGPQNGVARLGKCKKQTSRSGRSAGAGSKSAGAEAWHALGRRVPKRSRRAPTIARLKKLMLDRRAPKAFRRAPSRGRPMQGLDRRAPSAFRRAPGLRLLVSSLQGREAHGSHRLPWLRNR